MHIGVIFSFSEHMYTLTLIQGIDQFLLDICIELIVKRIDADRLFKNLREVCPDFRDRKGDDRKTAFFTDDIAVCDLHGFVIHLCLQFFLFIRQIIGFLFCLRIKLRLPEGINAGRACMTVCQCFIIFVRRTHHAQASLHKGLVQIDCLVCPVIIVKLAVRDRPVIADAVYTFFIDTLQCRTVNDRF